MSTSRPPDCMPIDDEAKNPAEILAALDSVFDACQRSSTPGLIVGVAQHGETCYRRAFGLACVALGVANTTATRMRLASTSKHFTALAVLLLAEEGRLDVDAGARRYLPELPDHGAEPTLRQLMNHTSGYRCYADLSFISGGLSILPKGGALAAQVRQSESNFAPGERMIYNNGAYHLLAIVVDRVSGMPFEQFLAQRIFEPLGMRDTECLTNDRMLRPGLASLHVPMPDGSWQRGIYPSEEIRGEGSVISTVDDMLRWLAHLRSPRIVGGEAVWQQMLAATQLSNGLVNPYGLGLFRHRYRGIEIIHHGGGVIGGACQMMTVPSHALDIIVITNGAPAHPDVLAKKVIDTMIDDGQLEPAETPVPLAPHEALLGSRYVSATSGLSIEFIDMDGALGLSFLNTPVGALVQRGDEWRIDFESVAIGPLVLKPGAAMADFAPAHFEFSESGQRERMERQQNAAPALAELAPSLLGGYRAPDLDAQARLVIESGMLQLLIESRHGPNTLTLQPWSADLLGWRLAENGLTLGGVMCVERRGGQVCGLRIDTPWTRHLRFYREGA